MARKRLREGLVQVYMGDGKGKTTAALGQALRACGHGLKVYVIQFMKGRSGRGEVKAAQEIPNLTIKSFGRASFVDREKPSPRDIEMARMALSHAEEIIYSDEYDLVVLDEVNVAMEWGLIGVEDVLKLIKGKPVKVELILTGRSPPEEILDVADLITEMRGIRHPYQKGIQLRWGIDY